MFDDLFSRFDTVHECDEQTDQQTDAQTNKWRLHTTNASRHSVCRRVAGNPGLTGLIWQLTLIND